MNHLTRIVIVVALCWPAIVVHAWAQDDGDRERQRLRELQGIYDRDCATPSQNPMARNNPLFAMMMRATCPMIAGDLHMGQMRAQRAAWESRDPFTCEPTSIDGWLVSVAALRRDAQSVADLARQDPPRRGEGNPLGGASQLFFETALNDIFGVAARALERQCLDIADRLYRMVIEDFTSADFAAARDRARVGIDDVRERRRQ